MKLVRNKDSKSWRNVMVVSIQFWGSIINMIIIHDGLYLYVYMYVYSVFSWSMYVLFFSPEERRLQPAPQALDASDVPRFAVEAVLLRIMGWLMQWLYQLVGLRETITGKSHISWENLWFPVVVPLSQNTDSSPWPFDSVEHRER